MSESIASVWDPCPHSVLQRAGRLHGICVFCYRDRLGDREAAVRRLEYELVELRAYRDRTEAALVALSAAYRGLESRNQVVMSGKMASLGLLRETKAEGGAS